MRKKSLLLLLLMAMFAPWAANAQNRTLVTIGDGTSTQRYPLPGYYGYQYDVFIYTPTAAPALEVDSDISSIAFNVSTNNTEGESTMKIWVKDVDATYALAAATTFDDYTAGAELVYENDDFSSTTGWNTFAFTRDFSHQGGKALLVAVRGEGCGTSACSRQCTYTNVSNTTWYKHQDNTDPGTDVSGYLGSSRANIQLELTYTGAVCLTPSEMTYSNIVENAATLSWTENGEGTAWVLEYSTASDYAGATTVNVSGTPTTSLSGLSALTTYYVRVKADCGSDWLTGSFTTTAHAETVGNAWVDDFEGTSCGWELINGTITNAWAWGTATNNGGTHALYVSNDGGTTNAYTIGSAAMVYVTKLLTFADGKYEFSYDWNGNGESTWDYMRVALVPASVTLTAGTSYPTGFGTTSLPTGWIALDGGGKLNLATAWQSISATVNMTAGNYYMVLAWRNDGSGGTNPPAAVDNVSITKVTCDQDVTDLAVSEITTSSATLSWEGGEATQWQVAYSTASNFEGATEEIVSTASYNMSGLQSSNTYYVKVRAYCGGEDFGSWSDVLSFATECEAFDLALEDFTENFDGITVASTYSPSTRILPICWSYINTSTYASNAVYPTIYYYSYTDYSNSTPNSLRFYSSYSSYSEYDPQDEYAILPAMENLAGKQITLWIRGYNATTPFKVGMITDPTNASTFVEITNDANPSLSTSYQEFTYIIPADATANHVAIMMEAANSSNSTRGLYIDDIKIADAPTCAKPTDLEATADALTATITWESEVGEYEVAYSTDNTANPDENIAGTATEETYTMNDLALGDHYFWVRANCGSDGYSEWVGPVNVHIGYCVPNPTSHDGSGITGVSFGMGDYVVENGGEGTSIPASAPYYGDYSNMIGAVQAGVESTIAITTGTGSYPYTFVIWVDFDNSLSFEDSEVVYVGKASSGAGTLEATITVPATQATGDYRMRIYGADSYFNSFYGNGTTNWEADHDPCSSGTYRHANDYTLRVLEAPSCLMPTNVAINYTGGNTATVTWEGTAETYNIDVNGTVTNNVTTPYTLEGLELATTYAVMVQANCEEEETSAWTEAVSFTTDLCMPEDQCEISFELTDSYGDGWSGCGIKVIDVLTNSVIATMEADDHDSWQEETDIKTLAVCDGREIQFVWVSGSYANECSYVVKDANGEVIFSGEDAMTEPVNYTVNCGGASYTLDIAGVGVENWEGGKGGYYLIASPVTVDLTDHEMTTGDYDLYAFDQAEEDEWRNYKQTAFNLEPGKGYLYAHKVGGEFTLTGTAYDGDGTIELVYDDNATDFQGWNLVGNPWGEKAYPDHAFYTMAEGGAGIDVTPNVAGTEVAPMTGIFVVAENEGETMTFTTEAPANTDGKIALNVTNSNKLVDRAIVRFGEGRQLPKFQLNPNHTKVYFQQEGKDYAIVNAEEMDEMPVSFKAENNGTYTLCVNAEEVTFAYLHLIDNMTGKEVNLLETPSYSFDAKSTDYANRFKLVFATGNNNGEDFAFFSNGSFVINNEGNATLQVIDVTGRMISSETINGCANVNVNAAQGVYMLRLVNGDNVKVQKVVVR